MAQTLADHVVTEIRAEMARQRLTQRQLADHLGLSQVQVSRRLTGQIEFRPTELERAAALMGVPVTTFLPVRDDTPVSAA